MTSEIPRHQCLIYGGAPSTHLPDIAETLVSRLRAKQRCLYLNSPTMVVGMRWHLASGGVDLDAEIQRGALILSSDRGHLVDGRFEVDRLIELLNQSVHGAIADGFDGLWAAGDMTWEFGHESNLDKLLTYERRLEDYMQGNPALSGICLYHKDTLPAHAIQTAERTHASIYVSATLSRLNPQFERLQS